MTEIDQEQSEELNPEEIFLNQTTFSAIIESMVLEGYTYFDAVLEFAAQQDREPDELTQFMSRAILDKVRKSAYDSGLMNNPEQSLDELT